MPPNAADTAPRVPTRNPAAIVVISVAMTCRRIALNISLTQKMWQPATSRLVYYKTTNSIHESNWRKVIV